MLNPWNDNYKYYESVRLQLLMTVPMLMSLRLLAEVLEFWAQRGILTSQDLLAGLIIRTSVYGVVFLALVVSYAVCQMDEGSCSSMSRFAGQVPKLGEHPIPIMGDGTIFQILAVAALIPEFFGGILQVRSDERCFSTIILYLLLSD